LSKLAAEAGEEDDTRRAAHGHACSRKKSSRKFATRSEAMSGDHRPRPSSRRRCAGWSAAPRRRRADRAVAEGAVDALERARRASQTLDQALRDCAFDPRELERVEERLFALRGGGAQIFGAVDELPALAEKFAADLAALDAGEARLAAEQAASEAEALYARRADALSKARKAAAKTLDKAVQAANSRR
jgi:DNA repair protein RecN (Recombination protein N)